MTRLNLATFVALLLSGSAAAGERHAQPLEFATISSEPTIGAGARIRVRTGSRWLEGRAVAATGDTLLLSLGRFRPPRTVVLHPASVLKLCGRQSRAWGAVKGAGAGLLAALAVGPFIAVALGGSASDGLAITGALIRDTSIVAVVPLAAVVGALLPGDRWDRVEIRAKP